MEYTLNTHVLQFVDQAVALSAPMSSINKIGAFFIVSNLSLNSFLYSELNEVFKSLKNSGQKIIALFIFSLASSLSMAEIK